MQMGRSCDLKLEIRKEGTIFVQIVISISFRLKISVIVTNFQQQLYLVNEKCYKWEIYERKLNSEQSKTFHVLKKGRINA